MEDQSAVIAFLADPANHGRPSGAVERRETHISLIFLAGDRAYKLKKAVTLPFLDFARLEDRHRFCRIELEVNRRAAPMLYRRLRAITREADGHLAWDGKGTVLDWVIEMARFDEAGLFDHLATTGQLHRRLIERLADRVVALHQGAEVTQDWGGKRGIAHVIATNDASFRRFVPALFAEAEIAQLTGSSRDWLERLGPLLEARRLAGKVRRCHGDLHLGNICLVEGEPVPFDAIEFNQEFACIDQFYDLAFLLMDLDRRDLDEFAALLLSRWLAATGDFDGLAALPLFLSLRAAIRSHVAAAMGRQEEARAYLGLAQSYLQPAKPCLLAVGGLSGSGKSHLARRLAPFVGARPGALVLRSDVARKILMGVAPETKLPAEAYQESVSEQVYDLLLSQAEQAVKAGQAAIVDAVFARPQQRHRVAALGARLGVPFTGLWLEADPEAMRRRVEERRHNASDANLAILAQQMTYDLGEIDWVRIDSSGDEAQTLALARAALEGK